ncbi:hypothetical protein BD408DRAFT_438228 [Parasitella parasitica]|nr:hypothetical protein BD408DRAFT_438228 [Parasitella parasitica]
MANQPGSTNSYGSSAEGGEGEGISRRASTSNSFRPSAVSSNQSTSNSAPSGSGDPNIYASVTGTTTSRYSKTSHTSIPTVMNYGNAVPGGSCADDRVPAPTSFAEFVMNNPDEHHQSLSQNGEEAVSDVPFVVGEQLVLYKLLIKEYNDCMPMCMVGVKPCWRKLLLLKGPILLSNTRHYAVKIEEMKEPIRGFDGRIEITRTQICDTLVNALHKIPAESLLQVVQECQWPNEDVSRDLELPLDVALIYRGTYRLPKRTVLPDGSIDQAADDAAARIKELGAIIHKLSIGLKGEIIPVKKEGDKPTTVLSDVKPTEKKIDYIERRKRTKIPKFNQRAASEAQQWLNNYEHLCEY